MEGILETEVEHSPRTNESLVVHRWRAERLRDLGLPRLIAEAFADAVDWREVAPLVERGCPPLLALEIVR